MIKISLQLVGEEVNQSSALYDPGSAQSPDGCPARLGELAHVDWLRLERHPPQSRPRPSGALRFSLGQ